MNEVCTKVDTSGLSLRERRFFERYQETGNAAAAYRVTVQQYGSNSAWSNRAAFNLLKRIKAKLSATGPEAHIANISAGGETQ